MEDAEEAKKREAVLLRFDQVGAAADTTESYRKFDFSASPHLGGEKS
jgi:hypothetical protein